MILFSGCPPTFVLHKDNCYGFFLRNKQKLKYREAKEQCQRFLNYTLATVQDLDESVYLAKMTVQNNPATPANATQVWSLTQSLGFSLMGNPCIHGRPSFFNKCFRSKFHEPVLIHTGKISRLGPCFLDWSTAVVGEGDT